MPVNPMAFAAQQPNLNPYQPKPVVGPQMPMTAPTGPTQPLMGGMETGGAPAGVGVPGPVAPENAALASTIGNIGTGLGLAMGPGPVGIVGTLGTIANALSPGVLSGLVSVNGLSTNNATLDAIANQNNSKGIVGPTSLMGLALGLGGPSGTAEGQAGVAPGSVGPGDSSSGDGSPGGTAGEAEGSAGVYKKGGKIPGKGPKMITAHGGEFVVSRPAVMEYGIKYLDKLNKQKLHK